MDAEAIRVLVITVVAALVAVSWHECAHVLVALRYGGRFAGLVFRAPFLAVRIDQTAVMRGATVPIALAGPAADLTLAALVFALGSVGLLTWREALYASLWPGLSLALNLLPLPHTDGWRVHRAFAS
jgi:Zn-dependent protease